MAERYPFKAFRGEIGFGDRSWPIRFQIAEAASGELRFRVRPMRYDRDTAELSGAWHRREQTAPFFKLRGAAPDGRTFESDHVTISGLNKCTTPAKTTLTLRLRCSKGTFRTCSAESESAPFIRYPLRGFEAFPALRTSCALGEVAMEGQYPAPKTGRLSGYLQVVPTGPVKDFAAWRIETEALCLHLIQYMSFAQANVVKAPIEEVWDGSDYEQIFLSQTKSQGRGQTVIHPMARQAFFESAVKAFFNPPLPIQNAGYALEWFAMSATYTEVRLLNAMTALENMADANLGAAHTTFLPTKRFQKIAKAMREAARDYVATHPSPPDAASALTQAEQSMIDALPAKMLDLNRRPLNEKLLILAAQWGVPLADVVAPNALAKAIRARNFIVHRGWYYEPAMGSSEQRDLWDHVLLMREIVIRFILTAIAYRGTYISFRGGQHDVAFPPSDASTGTGAESAQ